MKLSDFGLFWDVKGDSARYAAMEPAEAIADMRTFWQGQQAHKYIIPPISSDGGFLTRKKVCMVVASDWFSHSSQVGDGSQPQHDLNLSIAEVGMTLSRTQYLSVLRTIDYVSWLQTRMSYDSLRPTEPLHGNTRKWWKFAYNVAAAPIQRKQRMWSWAHMKEHIDLR